MDVETAQWLVSDEAAPYRERVRTVDDPSSLKAATDLRKDLPAPYAAAVLSLEELRRKSYGKLNDRGHDLFFTRDGLEQATNWNVARWRAERIVNRDVTRVIDAGCGLAIDALACQDRGLDIIAIERDPVTAIFAEANLAAHGTTSKSQVICADIDDVDFTEWLADPKTAIFLDPARRTPTHRSWDVADMSPSWETVLSFIDRAAGPVVAKLAPGFPRSLLPVEADVLWVSWGGGLKETSLWSYDSTAGRRLAVVLGFGRGEGSEVEIVQWILRPGDPLPPPGPLGALIYEPDPCVIRANAVGALASIVRAHPVADQITYLTGNYLETTPFARTFSVTEVFPYSEQALRQWAHANEIGVLVIKVRGLDVDPAVLRRRLKLTGKHMATVILTPTTAGTKVLVVDEYR